MSNHQQNAPTQSVTFEVLEDDDLEPCNMEHIHIYTDQPITLDFIADVRHDLRTFNIEQKNISSFAPSDFNTTAIVLIQAYSDLETIEFNPIQHTILIIPHNLNLETSAQLSGVIVYKRQANESGQQAIENVFHGLVKFYVAPQICVDKQDIQDTFTFHQGKYLHTYPCPQDDIVQLQPILQPIQVDDDVLVNITHHPELTLAALHHLIQSVTDCLTPDFDGTLFYSSMICSKPEQQNIVYISYLAS